MLLYDIVVKIYSSTLQDYSYDVFIYFKMRENKGNFRDISFLFIKTS